MNYQLPPFETQYSADNHVDAEDCVEESLCHIVYMMTGKRYSPRALGWMLFKVGQLDANGSGILNALAMVNKRGLIPYELWPTPDSFTWDSYYADVPVEVQLKAQTFNLKLIDPDLNKSPLWTELAFLGSNGAGSTLHWVAQFNTTQYFDSELGGPIKYLNYRNAAKLQSWSISLTQKYMGQLKTQKKGTELRIIIPATTPADWQALCEKFGLDPNIINEII